MLCPWGCSEFLHHAGTINLDIVLQRYLCKCYLLDVNDAMTKIEPARDDYIRECERYYDKWLENNAWRILPIIIMKMELPWYSRAKIIVMDLLIFLYTVPEHQQI